MKQFSMLVALVALMGSMSAHAIIRPGWERPILKAEMHEFDADGHEVAIGQDRILTMHKRDGQKNATTFSLVEEHRIFCVRAPCPQPRFTTVFNIVKIQRTLRGVKYTAMEKQVIDPRVRLAPPRKLEVLDVGRAVLTGARYRWNARITGFQTNRKLVGDPEPVFTIQ